MKEGEERGLDQYDEESNGMFLFIGRFRLFSIFISKLFALIK